MQRLIATGSAVAIVALALGQGLADRFPEPTHRFLLSFGIAFAWATAVVLYAFYGIATATSDQERQAKLASARVSMSVAMGVELVVGIAAWWLHLRGGA